MKKIIFISLLSFYLRANPEDTAEQCISTASPETISICTNLLEGIESEKSYALRCIAEFVAEGMNIENILTNDYYDSTSQNPVFNLMRFMFFPTMKKANNVLEVCAKSKNPALELGAHMARFNTSAHNTTSTIPEGVQAVPFPSQKPSQEEMDAAVQAIINQSNTFSYESYFLNKIHTLNKYVPIFFNSQDNSLVKMNLDFQSGVYCQNEQSDLAECMDFSWIKEKKSWIVVGSSKKETYLEMKSRFDQQTETVMNSLSFDALNSINENDLERIEKVISATKNDIVFISEPDGSHGCMAAFGLLVWPLNIKLELKISAEKQKIVTGVHQLSFQTAIDALIK